MSSIKAGVIMVSKFISPSDKRYSGAINYLDKEVASRERNLAKFNAFEELAHDQNLKRLTHVFNGTNEFLDLERKKLLKEEFKGARDAGSPMWQTVFSFDHEYLTELGILRKGENGFVDEAALKQATVIAMNKMSEGLGLGDTARWAAAIHYDQDNYHVHTMLVTKDPAATLETMTFRNKEVFRAKVPPKVQRATKSVFANSIANRDPTLARISYLMRSELVKHSMEKGYSNNMRIMRGVTELMNTLPKDRRLWKYGNNAMKAFIPQLDGLSRELMMMNNPKAFVELDNLLIDQSKFYEKTYGKTPEDAADYRKNQMDQLYKNMGNSLLKEMASLVAREEWQEKTAFTPEEIKAFVDKKRAPIATKKTIKKLQSALDETKQDYLNKMAYEREEMRKERQRQYDLEQQGRGY
jgi:hypothetical protein